MNNRQYIKLPKKEKKKHRDHNFMMFIKKLERDEILLNKCEIPKDDGSVYKRPWKL